MRLPRAVGLAAALRGALLLWGLYQDAHSAVRYTDVDYFVFSDAAACLVDPVRQHCGRAKGAWAPEWLGDPYARATYRYTPLLAFVLAPNSLVHPDFGKVLFALCDLLVGVMLYKLMRRQGASQKYAGRAVAAIWLLNPMIANISTRGSSESIVGALVVAVLSMASEGRWDAAAVVFGAAVHVKIFPFLYGTSLVAALYSSTGDKKVAIARLVRFGVLSFACFMLLNAACFVLCVPRILLLSTWLIRAGHAVLAGRSCKRLSSTTSHASTTGTTFRPTSTRTISPLRPCLGRPLRPCNCSHAIRSRPSSRNLSFRSVSASSSARKTCRTPGWSRRSPLSRSTKSAPRRSVYSEALGVLD